MAMGSLVIELQANVARLQDDMGRVNQVIENRLRAIDSVTARTARQIENMAQAGRAVRSADGVEQMAKEMEHLSHSTVGARREMLVLAHELATGNFKRAAGSLMVLGERLDIMGAVMSPVGLAVGVLAGGVLLLAAAAVKGAMESAAFARSLLLTGNYAGQTEGTYNALARQVSATTGATIGAAREMTQALMSTGRIGNEAIGTVSLAATRLADVSGQKSEEVAKDFARMSDGVLKWAVEANKQYHFVDGAIYDHIKALEDAGDKEQAMIVASKALYDSLGTNATQNLGLLERAWHGVKSAASSAWDAMLGIGRAETLDDRISKVKEELTRIQGARAGAAGGINADIYDSQYNAATALLGRLTSQKRNQEDNAAQQAARKLHDEQVVEAKQYWARLVEAHHTGAEQLKIELDKAAREGTLAGATPAQIAEQQERIRKQFAHGGGGIEHADLESLLKPLQDQIQAEDKLLAYRERMLKQYYDGDKLSIQDYYAERRTVIQANITRITALYDQEIAAIETSASKSADARARIESKTRADALRDQKQQALLSSSEQLLSLTDEQATATAKYRDEVTKLTAELDKLRRTQGNSAGDEFDRQHGKLQAQATVAGDTDTLNTLAAARSAAVAQAQMNQLKERAAVIDEQLSIAEKSIALQTQTGQQGELEGMRKLGEARLEAVAQLAQIAQQMQQIADASGLPALQTQAQQFKLHVQEVQASTNVLGKSLNDIFAKGLANMLDNTITRTKSLRQEFLDMANSIEQAITRIVATDLANQLFGTGGGSGGGGLIGQLVGLVGGLFGGASGSEAIGASATSTPDDLISGYRASGGPVLTGGMYEVNERGPELLTVANRTFLMMGQDSGRVTPMSSSNGGGRQNTFHLNIAVPPGTTRQTAQQQAAEIMRHAQIAMARIG